MSKHVEAIWISKKSKFSFKIGLGWPISTYYTSNRIYLDTSIQFRAKICEYLRRTLTPCFKAWTRLGSMDMLSIVCCPPMVQTWFSWAACLNMTMSWLAMMVLSTEMTTMGNTKETKVLTCGEKMWRGQGMRRIGEAGDCVLFLTATEKQPAVEISSLLLLCCLWLLKAYCTEGKLNRHWHPFIHVGQHSKQANSFASNYVVFPFPLQFIARNVSTETRHWSFHLVNSRMPLSFHCA